MKESERVVERDHWLYCWLVESADLSFNRLNSL